MTQRVGTFSNRPANVTAICPGAGRRLNLQALG